MYRLVLAHTRNADLGKPQIVNFGKGFRGINTVTGLTEKTPVLQLNKYRHHTLLSSKYVPTNISGHEGTNGELQNAYINAIGTRVIDVPELHSSGIAPTSPMPH